MKTTQSSLKVRPDIKGKAGGAYLVVAHPRCGTSRTFRVWRTIQAMLAGSLEGISIQSECQVCHERFQVQFFLAEDQPDPGAGVSAWPPQEEVPPTVKDQVGMLRWPQ